MSRASLLVFALGIFTCGCGTITANRVARESPEPSDHHLFRGVHADLEFVTDGSAGTMPIVSVLAFAADLPMSFIADVIRLPRTVKEVRRVR